MARGRKKQQELTTLEAYKNEIIRLKIVEKEILKSLEKNREQIRIFEEKVMQEEHRELMKLIEEKGITFDEVKNMISSIGKNDSNANSENQVIADKSEE